MSATKAVAGAEAIDESPYVGLSYFTEDRADVLFGRDAERTTIIGNLRNARLTLLYAESGVGKRSLLRAGLVAACAGGVLLDLCSAGPVGPHVIALLAGVYVTGFWIRNVESPNAVHAASTIALSTVIYALVLVAAGIALRRPSVGLTAGVELTAVTAMYNALLAPFAVAGMRGLDSSGRAPEAQ